MITFGESTALPPTVQRTKLCHVLDRAANEFYLQADAALQQFGGHHAQKWKDRIPCFSSRRFIVCFSAVGMGAARRRELLRYATHPGRPGDEPEKQRREPGARPLRRPGVLPYGNCRGAGR